MAVTDHFPRKFSLTSGPDDLVAAERYRNTDGVRHLVGARVVYSHCELGSSLDLLTLANVKKSAEFLGW